ncbi:M10 family metallopeptidase [Pseudomonas sp. SO81]|uniref:M10 family metallopeptidase n=1 Tax=Pseudomonas sp. SO81 TaxID=2983246 RepID=UPI0025A47FB7|nr:M10 family metallopeptidase [Pseudomonas sp. SO81]WJN59215.1 hypothetical protein OH686_10740 [Pseudomonas sp. SO81]
MPSPTGYTPSVLIPLSQDYLVDALLYGSAWQSTAGQTTLSYSFITPGQSRFSPYYSNNREYLSTFALTESQATAVSNVLASWSAVANLQFTAVSETSSSVGDLRFGGYSGMDEGTLAWAYLPSNGPAAGDVWIGPATSSADTSAGSYDFLTLLHEVGHALGLKHNFSTSPYNSTVLRNALDEVAYTVMSYNDAYSFYPTTPMVLDIAAIQYIYGANYSWNQGDTTYTWGADERIFETIWDGGGTDTIDASNQLAAVKINLNEGAYSNIGKTFIDYLYGNYQFNQGLAIAHGAQIENAIGSNHNDTLVGNALANVLTGGAGNDRLDGGAGADTLHGGTGNDTYVVDNIGDLTEELAGEGTDTISSNLSWTLGAELENLTLTGTAHLGGTGNALRNSITGNDGNNILDGMAGADTLAGGKGNDTYRVDLIQAGSGSTATAALEDSLTEAASAGTDTVQLRGSIALTQATTLTLGTNLENLDASATGTTRLNLTGNSANNRITGNAADNRLDGGAGADRLIGGLGNDTYVVDNSSDRIEELVDQGHDTVKSSVSWTLGSELENLLLTGTTAINGTGNALDNQITGNSANNVLNGGIGADTLIGGLGNDTYVVDNINDVATELAGQGTDTVSSNLSWTLGAELENLTLTGTAHLDGTGNALRNSITGNDGNNILDGMAGADTLAGGKGNDTYIVDLIQAGSGSTALEDSLTEAASAGTDTVQLRGSIALTQATTLTLGANLENLDASATGTTRLNLTGNSANNLITGNAANNRLDGGTGVDTLIGGLGNDTYVLDNARELNLIQELADEGTDTLQIAYTNASTTVAQSIDLSGRQHLENITLTGTGLFNLTGNDANNVLIGNASVNVLTGGLGDDRLDGGAGADRLIGGLGNDTYVVDNAADRTEELAGEGIDTVKSGISWTLGRELENLLLTGTTAINGTGNALDNQITGNSANNVLNGGIGADTLIGGLGNDTYVVDNINDVATELAGQGTDTVSSNLSWTLGAELENLTLTGTAHLDGTGNALRNSITGNDGNNILDGMAGADTLAGGKGNDTYIVDLIQAGSGSTALEDSLTEAASAGTDTVQLRGSIALTQATTLTLGANLENLDASATGTTRLNLTGNSANNLITGNAANNRLDGGTGVDTLIGGLGNDTYVLDNARELNLIQELADEGTDTLQIAYTNASTTVAQSIDLSGRQHLENITLTGTGLFNLTGNDANNVLIGNASVNVLSGGLGDDRLDGGAGIDTLIGGLGNDTYVLDNASELNLVQELADEGTDTLRIAYTNASTTVAQSIDLSSRQHLENITLTGTGLFNLTGNDANNVLTGNAANNRLDGGAGADTLIGGLGHDTYVVDNASDVVTEFTGQGTDTVSSSISWTLGAELENLVLTGSDAINGTGNEANNILTGNASDNLLIGNAGDDRLDGGAGSDTLIGGLGNDTYVVDNIDDVVTEVAGEGADTVSSSLSWTLGAELENLTLTGTANLDGIGNALRNRLTGNDGNNILDGGAGADTLSGGKGNDTYIVDLLQLDINSTTALEDNIIEAAGAGIDTVLLRGNVLSQPTTLTLGANLENLDASALNGITTLNLTGNGEANTLTGDANGNSLDGGAGADTLIGGGGNDFLFGNLGADVLTGGEGADIFLFRALSELGMGAQRDVITDFNASQGDQINLSALDANSLLSGNNAFTFIGSASFTGLGQLRFQNQILYGNLSGDMKADFEIKLLGVSSLDASSLLV